MNNAAFEELLARCLAGERLTGERLDIDGADGRGGPVLLSLVPIRDRYAIPVGCTAVVQDVREQVASQQALAEGEGRVRRAEALAMTGTFVVDAENGSAQWSEGMYHIHGVDPAAFVPTLADHLALVAGEDRSQVADLFAQTLAGGVVPGMDHRIERGAGVRSWVFVAVEPRMSGDGQVLGLSGICQDINARVEVEAAVHRALAQEQAVSEELRELDALKDEFLSTISHELRTPLTAIAGYTELLEDLEPDNAALIEPIARNAREMQTLVEELLLEAQLRAGRIALEPVWFELAPAVRTFLAELPDEVARARVVVDIDEQLGIEMDQRAFVLVLGNLISNAAKYAPDGPVTVAAEATPAGVVVSVADVGEGVAPEYVERVFDRFFRAPGAYAMAGGTGFGLSIVRRYVELHGGTVTCESVPGHGATFAFTVPLRRDGGA